VQATVWQPFGTVGRADRQHRPAHDRHPTDELARPRHKDDLRTPSPELRSGLAEVRAEVSGAIDRKTRWMVMFVAGWSTLVVGAARLLW
jgi:hypothetical protein